MNLVPFNPGGSFPLDNASATISYSVAAGNGGFSFVQTCNSWGGDFCTPAISQGATTFIYGVPFHLRVDASTAASAGGAGSASSDYANTIRWAGFDSILDAQGQPIAGFSVLSDSGFDYAAVPEPATAALLMMGMLTLATRRRSEQ